MSDARPLPAAGHMIENHLFEEIRVGDAAVVSHIVTAQELDLCAIVSGDVPPASLDPGQLQAANAQGNASRVLGAGLIAGVLDMRLPGPGTTCLELALTFARPIHAGDTITTRLTVTARHSGDGTLELACTCRNQYNEEVMAGSVRVRAPRVKIRRPHAELPEVHLSRHERFRALLAAAANETAQPTAVAHPCEAHALAAAVEAAQAGLITPILVGPRARIEKAAATAGVSIRGMRLVEAPHSVGSARIAVDLVRHGEAGMLMKGSLHTAELLHAVLDPDQGLRTGRRLSHVYLMDVPSYPRPLLVTDAVVNIAPDLEQKRDIVQNAIHLAHIMGIAAPRVAILSAVETVDPKLRSTLDAAALCKMADRGQIHGGIVDGPLAFDNAVNPEAAAEKGIVSEVAGRADILVVPDLEAGNMLAKQLIFMAGADAAGVVLGARVPIILTSRADAVRTRLASCAVALLMAHGRATTTLPDRRA